MLEKEFAEQNSKTEESPPKEGESKSLDESMQTSSASADKAEEIVPDVSAFGSDQRPLRDPPGTLFPDDSHETDQNAKNFLQNFPPTLTEETKTHTYSWMTSGS